MYNDNDEQTTTTNNNNNNKIKFNDWSHYCVAFLLMLFIELYTRARKSCGILFKYFMYWRRRRHK